MRSNLWILFALLSVVPLVAPATAQADELHVRLHPESTGPFPGGVGGQIPYSVSVEIVDVESDGYDSQGIHGVGWNLLTDMGVSETVAREAMRLAAHKLPIKTKFVSRGESS